MKKCSKCKKYKSKKCFSRDITRKDLLQYICKKCNKEYNDNNFKTKDYIINRIYAQQVYNSKKRNHNKPSYTKGQLKQWLIDQPLFHKLFVDWVESNYDRNLTPSVDRINNLLGYDLNNIQLMTWCENNKKGRVGVGVAVVQYDLNNNFIKEYKTQIEASKCLNINQASISGACSGRLNKAGGYIWKLKSQII